MDTVATVALALTLVLVGAWLAAIVAVFVKALRPGALLQRGNMQVPLGKRYVLAFCALPLILLLAAGILLNTVAYACTLFWYRVRGKPLPPAPSSGTRNDRAA